VARPALGPEEAEAARAAVLSGWISQGPEVSALEAELARFCGTAHAVATGSGTAALHVALLALGVGPGDEVVTTPLSCIASANPILFQGARPVFADVEPDTGNLDPASVKERLGARTRAILPVHLFGQPADLDPLLGLAEAQGVPLVEDASQALGARHRGRPVGGLGRAGCVSLYTNKLITSGEGGVIVTDDGALAERMRAVRNFGQLPGQHFTHAYLGGNHKMTDIQAAVARVQLAKAPRLIEGRRRSWAALWAGLRHLGRLLAPFPAPRPWGEAVPFASPFLFPSAGLRDRARERLHAAGVETRPFFSVIPAEAPYRALGYDLAETPVAADLHARGLYVSAAPDLGAGERALILDTLGALARDEGLL
jgi:perosamine synthetase